jgi:hypothetical protein
MIPSFKTGFNGIKRKTLHLLLKSIKTMSLTNCTICRDLPSKFINLEIGLAEASTEYRVYLTHLPTGRETMYDVTTDVDGRLILTSADQSFNFAGGWYKIEIVNSSRYYINATDTIEIDGVECQCLKVQFVNIEDEDGLLVSFEYIRTQIA